MTSTKVLPPQPDAHRIFEGGRENTGLSFLIEDLFSLSQELFYSSRSLRRHISFSSSSEMGEQSDRGHTETVSITNFQM